MRKKKLMKINMIGAKNDGFIRKEWKCFIYFKCTEEI